MKRLINCLVLCLSVGLLAIAGDGCSEAVSTPVPQINTWTTDLPKALVQAGADHKAVLLDFSGSDWCPDCRKLSRKVLETPAFKAYADTNLVLVDVDFPQNKPQPDDLKKANNALQNRFDVQGFPTVILLNADGKVLTKQEGYDGANVNDFIAALEKARKSG